MTEHYVTEKSTSVGRINTANLLTATDRRNVGGGIFQGFNLALLNQPPWVTRLVREDDLPGSLKRLNTLYTARFAKIGRFPNYPGAPRESSRYRWQLFAGTFDTEWEPYFEMFADMLAGGVNMVWGQAVGYPGFPQPETRNALLRWLDQRLPPSQHVYAAYPNASAHDVRASIRVRRELLSLARNCADPGLLADRFNDTVASLQHCLGSTEAGVALVAEPEEPAPTPVGCTGMSGFVALAPIRPGRSGEVQRRISDLGTLDQSPFQRVPGTHFARFAILDSSAVAHADRDITLKSPWLLFIVDFDGVFGEREFRRRRIDKQQFLEYANRLAMVDELKQIWENCFAFDGDFAEFLWRGVVPRRLLFRDYPDATLTEIREALRFRQEVLTAIRSGGQTLDRFLLNLGGGL